MDCIIAMRSQTYAAKGERLLRRGGISCSIISIDPSLTRHGCAYGLRLSAVRCQDARNLLEKYHLAYGDVLGG